MGYVPLKDGSGNPSPLDPIALMDRAAALGLAGIEIPLTSRVPSFEGRVVELATPTQDLGAALRERGLRIVADYGIVTDDDAQHLIEYLKSAKALGATVVRAVLSSLLCGDRRSCPGGWPARLKAAAARLREVLPTADALGLAVAIENHQDATTDDLLWLGEMAGKSPAFGITFDTGNPLAMMEDPVEAARRLAPLIRHVHLKDYTIHFAPEGYRLVRCSAGEGVVNFPAILSIVRGNSHDVLPGIEIAAQATRTIPILDPGWWTTYPERRTVELIKPLSNLWARGRPADEPYASAWERGAGAEQVIAEEWEVLERSVKYFRTLLTA
jgi:sugar phosphate isomerase/epimerase